MIRRIVGFRKNDWKHIGFLAKNMFKQILRGNLHEAKEVCVFIKIYTSYDSKRVD